MDCINSIAHVSSFQSRVRSLYDLCTHVHRTTTVTLRRMRRGLIIRKYGYSVCGRPVCDQRLLLLVRGTRYSAIPILSLDGIHDVYLAEGTMNGDRFVHFLQVCLLPHLLPFNGVNPQSVVIIDNASIHHVEEVRDLIEVHVQAGARLLFLPLIHLI